jgi:hypothetical protein
MAVESAKSANAVALTADVIIVIKKVSSPSREA